MFCQAKMPSAEGKSPSGAAANSLGAFRLTPVSRKRREAVALFISYRGPIVIILARKSVLPWLLRQSAVALISDNRRQPIL